MYDFHLADVASFVLRRKARLVALQLPEGLIAQARAMVEELEKSTGARFLVLADPCYGACDVNLQYKEYSDALVHFGHSEMPSLQTDEGVLFVEVTADYRVLELVPEAAKRLCDRVGLVTTAQHIDKLETVRAALEREGKQVFVGRGDGRIKHPGQVLGCNVSAASSLAERVDCYLYIGSGDFHPLAVSLGTGKPVIVLDPFIRQIRDVDELKDRTLRQRHGAIVRAAEARSYGILVSSKPGQKRLALAQELRAKLDSKGKKAVILVANNIDPDRLAGYGLDAFVSTACPRLAIDDYMRYKQPILTPKELEIVLGERKWEDYVFDSISV